MIIHKTTIAINISFIAFILSSFLYYFLLNFYLSYCCLFFTSLPVLLLLFGVTTFCVAFFNSDVVPLLFTFCASLFIFSSSVNCSCFFSDDNGSTILGSNPFVLIGTPFTVNVATNLELDAVVAVVPVCLVFFAFSESSVVVDPSGTNEKLEILATNLSSRSILYRNSTIFEYSPVTLKFKSHNLKSALLASSSLEVPFVISNLNLTPLSVA